MKKFVKKSILVLSIIGSISFIFLLVYLFVYALQYWRDNFPLGYPKDVIAFYTAMIVAITTVIFQWVEGRIKSIADSFKMLKDKGGAINGKITKVRK